MLPTHTRLSGSLLTGLADPQAEGDLAWSSRAQADRTGSSLAHQTGEPAPARLVGMGRHPTLYQEKGLDDPTAEDDAQSPLVSCGSSLRDHWLLHAFELGRV